LSPIFVTGLYTSHESLNFARFSSAAIGAGLYMSIYGNAIRSITVKCPNVIHKRLAKSNIVDTDPYALPSPVICIDHVYITKPLLVF